MTYVVSGGALNSSHALAFIVDSVVHRILTNVYRSIIFDGTT